VHEVEHNIEKLNQLKQEEDVVHEGKQAAAELKKEAQHEVEEVAANLLGRQALNWLKDRFVSLIADQEGVVSIEELAQPERGRRFEGQDINDLIGQAGLNPSWSDFEKLDSNKDGRLSFEEFKAHVCGEKKIEEVDIVVEETAVTQRCWGCC